jgi:hypothetical protein
MQCSTVLVECGLNRLVDVVEAPHVLVEARGWVRLHAVLQYEADHPSPGALFQSRGGDLRAWIAASPRPQHLLQQNRAATLAAGVGPGAGRGRAGRRQTE